MKKFLTPTNVMLPLIMGLAMNSFAQITGDFQTKNATGNWSDFNAWNVYNGSAWIAAIAGQIPAASTSVFVQATHTISIDNAGAVCNDLNVNAATTSKIAFPAAAGILNIKRNMILFSTGHNCFGTWTAGAKIVFSGTGVQGFTNLSVNSVFVNIEVNKSAGSLITSSNLRFGSFTLTSGNFIVGSGNEIQGSSGTATIDINGGTWTQTLSTTKINNSGTLTSPIGALNINYGTMVLGTSNSTGGFQFSTINITNGGILSLNNFAGNISISTSISEDAISTFNTALTSLALPSGVTFNGIVNYNHTGAQTINAVTYTYLKLSGTGVKTLGAGVTIIPANGTLEMSGIPTSPTLSGGTLSVSSTGPNLIYSSTGLQTATANEWNTNFQNVTINNPAGVSMAGLVRTIPGSLNLTNGTLNIGAGGGLILDGASLNRTNGFIGGTTTSDLTITGTIGGAVLLPLTGTINLKNVTISGTRTLSMNGSNNMSLNGIFNIGSTATYDNGGESEILNGGGGSINITGKFITRDVQGFSATNAAIPGITPVLNSGSTIEYGLLGDQTVQGSTVSYQDVTFSGSGTKTPSSTFTPAGTVYITGSAILDASSHNIGDGITLTNLTMDAGRLILGTTGTQPMMAGTYNLSGGVIQFDGSGSQTIRSRAYQAIEVTGIGVGNSSGNITLNDAGTFTVTSGGAFVINADAITGPAGVQKITVENGGIFRCGNNEGFNGFTSTLSNFSSIHQNIENIILNPGSTVEYMRSGNQPITNANGLIYSNLLISGTGNKTAPAGILTVQGNLMKSGAGTFAHNGGTVLLNGIAPQSFAGLTYNNLILSNNTKTTSGNCTIIDSIKINTGTVLYISPSDTITLHSDATKTARMAQLDGSINYNSTGKFVVERYISPRRAWRFLSVPTNSLQTIKEAWQEGALNSGSDPIPGFGTQITSNRASWLADGFDVFSAGGSSMKTYNPVTDSYDGIISTLNSFVPGLGGYMTFIRGNRTATTFGSPVSSTVLRSAGKLFTGNQPAINVISGKIIPVNNQFASPLDLRKISTSLNIFYYVWDPNRGGGFGFGAFQTLSWNGTDYDVVPGNSGSYGATNNFIESGQAFFVSTLGADTSLQLTENTKSSATPIVPPFIPVRLSPQRLRVNLYGLNTDSSILLADGALIVFDGMCSNEVDGMDAKKLVNSGENLSVKTGSKLLSVERRHTITRQDTIFLNLSGIKIRPYRFEFIADKLNQPGLTAFLEDNYDLTKTPLNLNANTIVDFTVVNNPGSYAADRFRIVLIPSPAIPVTFTSVKAYREDKNINIEWLVEHEIHMKQYEVEKSINGVQFTTLAVVPATNNGSAALYISTDAKPVQGYNYYRIKSVDITGKTAYTHVVKVSVGRMKQDITVYPNPVTDGIVRLQFNNQPAGSYNIRLINKSGQLIVSKQISHTEQNSTEVIEWDYKPAHGMYQLEVTKPGGEIKYISVMY